MEFRFICKGLLAQALAAAGACKSAPNEIAMDHITAGQFWNANADAWTQLARAGYDVYRDLVNTPGFLALLPDIAGQMGLDLGCGEGHNTRLLAQRGATMTAIDIAPTFIAHAMDLENALPQGIDYQVASAVALPFEGASFDFATAFMSLMDIPEMELALGEAFRVIKPGGFLQFSILHPCFNPPHRKNVRDASGKTIGIQVGDYFAENDEQLEEWLFSAAPTAVRAGLRKFQIPVFHRSLSHWINAVVAAGFAIEAVAEPRPDAIAVADHPAIQDSSVVAYFLILRCRK